VSRRRADKLVIGLTGSFGSGCTTVAEVLADPCGFHLQNLSRAIRQEAEKRQLPPGRAVLQDIGDDLRRREGNAVLAKRAVSAAQGEARNDDWVLDGIRNTAEVENLRSEFARFYLLAVDATRETRYARLKDLYAANERAFEKDDDRDRAEPWNYGQQVAACVDLADVLLLNEEDFSQSRRVKTRLTAKLQDYVELMRSPGKRPPTHVELLMHHAYSASLRSSCLKRQVGAVIATPEHAVVASGYNEVPAGEESCRAKLGECYRDSVRRRYLETVKSLKCQCGRAVGELQEVDPTTGRWPCPECGTDLGALYQGGKVLDLCRALHAEEMAILQVARLGGVGHRGMLLYTTTFPCLLCARKVVQAGIKTVVYVEPYPVKEARTLLLNADVQTQRFEGVKSQAFHKLFKAPTETPRSVDCTPGPGQIGARYSTL
jgi:deoxycytidylate deaminase